MKPIYLAQFAALVAARTIEPPQQVIGDDSSTTWDHTPSVLKPLQQVVNTVAHSIDQALEIISRAGHNVASTVDDWHPGSRQRNKYGEEGNRQRRNRRNKPTVYELIKNCKQARKFSRLLDEHKDIRKRLDDSHAEYTVFVPTDEAFEKLPRHIDPDREFLEKLIEYHVVKGEYAVGRIMAVHTIPTVLEERTLNRLPQRLRVSVGLYGIHLNFYSQLVASNIVGSNGIVHAVDNVLVPPPREGKLIESLPGKFSTFAFAMEKTGLAHDLRRQSTRGSTIFAPTNNAWMKLSPQVNEWLFSDRGERYLRALLKYHVSMNETLYSDAYYEEDDRPSDHEDSDRKNRRNRRGRWEDDDDVPEHEDDTTRRRRRGGRRDDDEDDDMDDDYNRRKRRHGGRDDNDDDEDDDGDDDDGDDDDADGDRNRRSRRRNRHRHRNDVDDKEEEYFKAASRNSRRGRDDRNLDDALRRNAEAMAPSKYRRVYLESLLKGRTIEVDINRWMGLASMEVNNGKARVSVQDGVARDGVVQVVESVLVPPVHAGQRGHEEDKDRDFDGPEGLTVSELRKRLEKFVEDEDDYDEDRRKRRGRKGRKGRGDDEDDDDDDDDDSDEFEL
jgi:uncharacterized surface protein with fasciclin (FAS1) repeats